MTKIKEDYVSFETAKLLKEKGFNEPCYRWYDGNGDICAKFITPDVPLDYFSRERCLCPTHQMTMKWLREKHELYIEVSLSCDREDKNAKIFDVSIFNIQNHRYKKLSKIQGYEQACDVAIKYCLEHLI